MWYQQEHDACGIGSIVNIDGRKDHKVLDDALHIVEKLEHRAGKDATGEVGDGVGILTQISHKFFAKYFAQKATKEAAKESRKAGIGSLVQAEEGDYGVGMFFLPQDTLRRTKSLAGVKCPFTRRSLEKWLSTACPVSASVSLRDRRA